MLCIGPVLTTSFCVRLGSLGQESRLYYYQSLLHCSLAHLRNPPAPYLYQRIEVHACTPIASESRSPITSGCALEEAGGRFEGTDCLPCVQKQPELGAETLPHSTSCREYHTAQCHPWVVGERCSERELGFREVQSYNPEG